MADENSNSNMSRVANPMRVFGNNGFSMFLIIWMVMTAPMKMDMMTTMAKESIPCFFSSSLYCRKNMLHLSGRVKTLTINCV